MFYFIRPFILLAFALFFSSAYALAANMKILSDISYGKDIDQVLDVYIPPDAKDAPVIFMVHGGAWSGGDKANKPVVENKVAHWVTKGFIFISTNYRTLPKIGPAGQAKDVAAALYFSQQKAHQWGGSPKKFILMGHSSGAHLVSLVSSNYRTNAGNQITPLLGAVSMDSSAYDIVKRMSSPNPPRLYKRVFGSKPDVWKELSPIYSITDKLPPFLAICSQQSKTACVQAKDFIAKAQSLGASGKVLPVDLSHREINAELGKDLCYTHHVDDFFQKLSPNVQSLLKDQDTRAQKICAEA